MTSPDVRTTSIVATSPGDIIITFIGKDGPAILPLKTFTWSETNGVTSEYGIGNHEKMAQVQGKKDYKLDFTLGTWYVSRRENPATWERLLTGTLIHQGDQRLSKEFTVNITGREGGDFQSQPVHEMASVAGTIESFKRCILIDSGGDIPEVGGTISRKYSATCFTISNEGNTDGDATGGSGGGTGT
jgi:hypothetical protein